MMLNLLFDRLTIHSDLGLLFLFLPYSAVGSDFFRTGGFCGFSQNGKIEISQFELGAMASSTLITTPCRIT